MKEGPRPKRGSHGGRRNKGKKEKNITAHGVFKLSKKILSSEELKALDKGLKSPPPRNPVNSTSL